MRAQPDHTRSDWVTRPGASFFLVVSTARHRLRCELSRVADAWRRDNLADPIRLDGNGLHSQCAPLPSAALLYLWAHISCGCRGPRIIGSGVVGTRTACSQQHRRGYVGRRLIIICTRDLEKIRLTNDSSRVAPGWGGRPPIRKNKTRNSLPLLALAASCTACIRKNTDTHPSA